MPTYQLLSGEVLKFSKPSPEVGDFLARVRVAANDPTVTIHDLIELIYGLDNPLLDRTILPGRALVTRAVFANPVYQVLADQIGHKRIQAGLLDMDAARARYTVSVPDASRRLGITPASVRAAIHARKLAAHFENGQWWVSEDSLASYKVTNRGRRKSPPTAPKRA